MPKMAGVKSNYCGRTLKAVSDGAFTGYTSQPSDGFLKRRATQKPEQEKSLTMMCGLLRWGLHEIRLSKIPVSLILPLQSAVSARKLRAWQNASVLRTFAITMGCGAESQLRSRLTLTHWLTRPSTAHLPQGRDLRRLLGQD